MSEDLTNNVADTDESKLTLILTIVRKLETHGAILVQLLDRLDRLADSFDKLALRVDAVETRLTAVETRLDAVETRLDAVEVRLQSLEQTLRRSVHNLGRGQSVLNDAILKIHIGFLDIDERLQGLERRPNSAKPLT
ncbi:MAG TPA: hypothetical protein VHH35_01645 [Pyrinomonadaceae bacterium]|nr:hypothetical protein [Pyrinomonadaceae bacterium]